MIVLDTISYLLMWHSLDKRVAITTAHDYSKNLLSLPFWSKNTDSRARGKLYKVYGVFEEKKIAVLQIIKSLSQDFTNNTNICT